MNTKEITQVRVCVGQLQAEVLRALLEAYEIPTLLLRESAGRAYGLEVGELGWAQLWVASDQAEQASELLAAYDRGELEDGLSEPGAEPDA
mgnify:CR=1 FL=1